MKIKDLEIYKEKIKGNEKSKSNIGCSPKEERTAH